MNWLQTILALLQLLPTILATIVSVTTIFKGTPTPVPVTAALKKALVMDAFVHAKAPTHIAEVASAYYDSSVAMLTAAGVMEKE